MPFCRGTALVSAMRAELPCDPREIPSLPLDKILVDLYLRSGLDLREREGHSVRGFRFEMASLPSWFDPIGRLLPPVPSPFLLIF